MRERRLLPLSSDPEFLPSKLLEKLEKETGKRVLRLTVHPGQVSHFEVVLGNKKEEEAS